MLFQRIVLLALCAITVFFSLYKLTESPPVWYDEGWYIQTASNIAETGINGLRLSPTEIAVVSAQTTVGYPLIYPLAGWIKLLGLDVFNVRALMIVFLLGFVLSACYLAKRMWGTDMALGVFALIATLPTLYGNGKSVLGEVPGLLYLAIFLVCFYIATQSNTHKRAWLLLSALFAGICVVTKPLFMLLIPAIFIAVIFECKHKLLRPVDVLLGILAGLVPIVGWVYIQFGGADSLEAVLAYYANPYEIQNLSAVILSNAGKLFTDLGTLYLSVAMILWIGSLSIRVKIREKISGVEMIAFFFSLLVILAFLRTAGWYRYLFPAQAVVLIFLPHTLYFLAAHTKNSLLQKTIPYVISILAIFGVYQLSFNSWVADAYNNTRTAQWTEYFAAMPESVTVFFYNTPEVAIFMPHENYYQYLRPAGIELGKDQLEVLGRRIPQIIVTETDVLTGDPQTFPGYNIARQIDKYSILTPGP